MSVSDIYNFIQIDDLVATGGQPTATQFQEAHDAGYEIVINLAPNGLETSLPGEDVLLRSLDIEYHHIPVAWDNPSLVQFEQFERLMQSISGRRTLIHCQANYRVTAFYALYATSKLGWNDEQADAFTDRIWTSNAKFQMDDTWREFIVEVRRWLREKSLS